VAFSQRKPHEVLNAASLDRKSGIRGPKTMGEALPKLFVPEPCGSFPLRA
jgi:hypothetical protein